MFKIEKDKFRAKPSKTVSVRMYLYQLDKIDQLAKENGTTRNDVIVQMIEHALSE